MAKHHSTLSRLLAGVGLFALSTLQCNNAICEDLRDELFEQKLQWGRCDDDTDCIKILGNSGDCTGVFSCDFAINRSYRTTAERRIVSLPEETVDCVQCASPNCVSGDISICEPTSRQCIIVTEILGEEDSASLPSSSGEDASDSF